MPLIVQNVDGNVANANSYVSVAFFKSYALDIGVTLDSYSDTQLEQALVQGRQYIDTQFKFDGYRVERRNQVTEFPRSKYYDDFLYNSLEQTRPLPMPLEIQQAQCEYAIIDLTGNLYFDPDDTLIGAKSYEVQVGPVRESRSYFGPKPYRKTHTKADSLVRASLWVIKTGKLIWRL